MRCEEKVNAWLHTLEWPSDWTFSHAPLTLSLSPGDFRTFFLCPGLSLSLCQREQGSRIPAAAGHVSPALLLLLTAAAVAAVLYVQS